MGKNHKETSDSSKETIEVPRKLGFGRNNYEVITMTETTLEYLKNGKGSPEEVALLINEVKNRDPGATVEVLDKTIRIGFSRPFELRPYLNPRRREDATERERKRLKEAIERVIDAEQVTEEEDEEWREAKRKEFPTMVKYRTEDEENHIRMQNELWIESSNWRFVGTILLCVVKDRYGDLSAEEQLKKLLALIEYCD